MLHQTLIASTLLSLVGCFAMAESGESNTNSPMPAIESGSRAYVHSYNVPGHGVALQGFSPVSYFEGRAEQGSALFAVEHEGVTYHLAHARQVATFRENPGKYVPAYGGWCAFGMSVDDKFPVDPTAFAIVDGRLLLFLRNDGIDARELWMSGKERELLSKAGAHWTKVQG